jgi:hypothetical protein
MPKITQPTKLPPLPAEKIEALTDAIRDGLSLVSASKFVELSLPQVEKWVRMYPALKIALDKASADHEHRLLQIATDNAARDGKLAIAILERRHAQWNKTERQEIKQTQTGTVSPELLRALASAPEKIKETTPTHPTPKRL